VINLLAGPATGEADHDSGWSDYLYYGQTYNLWQGFGTGKFEPGAGRPGFSQRGF
jgi:hypothetical protein